ncbi:MAG: methyltransferase domain-containing protein [Pyrinomonadaceae bacterium]
MFRQRSHELEFIDTGAYTPDEYEGCLVELRRVNRWLGDNRAIEKSLLAELNKTEQSAFSVLDVGAGSGELLRVVARWAAANGRQAFLTGLELNARSARSILQESSEYPNITALRGDALNLPLPDDAFDYVICSLFTHHFQDDAVITVLKEMNRVARRAIFVIDLNRHPVSYLLYTTVARLFLHNRLIRHDGALSILRSFRPGELQYLAQKAGLQNVSVKRRFPFRLVLAAHKSVWALECGCDISPFE